LSTKYDELAERFTEHEYGDPERYFGHRAGIVASLGPPLAAGDTILDLACADGSAVPPLAGLGLRYVGVDASDAMLEVARRRHGDRARFELGDLLTYAPPEPVAATTIFRSLHVVDDRVAFVGHVAAFTEKKLVFDVSPRRHSLDRLRAELRDAGFGAIATRPFLVPQHGRLSGQLVAGLQALEHVRPAANLLLRRRFGLVCAAFRP
jgi:SAM-dependent methyltransferase